MISKWDQRRSETFAAIPISSPGASEQGGIDPSATREHDAPMVLAAPEVGGLLERELEFELLTEALVTARADEGRLLLVSGEAGVGKTALVNLFCAKTGHATRVLRGSCDALFTAPTRSVYRGRRRGGRRARGDRAGGRCNL